MVKDKEAYLLEPFKDQNCFQNSYTFVKYEVKGTISTLNNYLEDLGEKKLYVFGSGKQNLKGIELM